MGNPLIPFAPAPHRTSGTSPRLPSAPATNKVVGAFKETGSGVRLDRAERRKVMALAQARQIDTVLVTELSRCESAAAARSTCCIR